MKTSKTTGKLLANAAEVSADDILAKYGIPMTKAAMKVMRQDPKNFARWVRSQKN